MRQDRKKLKKSPNKWNEEVGANILSNQSLNRWARSKENSLTVGKPLWWL